MSQQVIRIVRPTKIELIRLRRRLTIARRLHKVLKDRLVILTQELISLIRDALSLRREIHNGLDICDEKLAEALSVSTLRDAEVLAVTLYEKFQVIVGSRVSAGVRVPLLDVEFSEYSDALTRKPLSLIDAARCYRSIIEKIVKLTEIEYSILRIGSEVSRVKRRVNALEYILIPRLINTIKFLEMKFEEREREDKIRLKKVKELLLRKAGG